MDGGIPMTVYQINGPVVIATGATDTFLNEMVKVGNKKLTGEVIAINGDMATIQVYEETSMLKPGEVILPSGKMLSAVLGPGMIGNIYDGIQRPLKELYSMSGDFIGRGLDAWPIDIQRIWDVQIFKDIGDKVSEGEIYAALKESPSIEHRLLVPQGVNGIVKSVEKSSRHKVTDTLMTVETDETTVELKMYQEHPVRIPRKLKEQYSTNTPLITGQRAIDIFFPISKGGTAAIPGGFGTGKTMTQHQLAKWADADVIVYIGCGERGNEMTEVLNDFPELKDPKTNNSLMDRTVLIANTSNMPVSAREASIYTGITIAEYYRDMGYDVAVMADSTSRWAEALRELSGRLEEMPAEEGYPSYLSSRIAQFYERAGIGETFSGKEGSITIIGAVSPAGGDFSEPVTQNTKRYVKTFWGLDRNLAYSRHYPSINWLTSYSEYLNELDLWFDKNVDIRWSEYRKKAMSLLSEDDRLGRIIRIVGESVLADEQKIIVQVSSFLKVGILQQNAFSAGDSFCSLKKQFRLLKTTIDFYNRSIVFIKNGVAISAVLVADIISKVRRMKEDLNSDDEFDGLDKLIDEHFSKIEKTYNLTPQSGVKK